MDTTRASLLIRIRNPRDTQAWSEFHDLYAPLLYRYARARGLSHDDADDIRSSCYESIVRQIAQFRYEREKGSFKSWLRTLVNRRIVDRLRKRNEKQANSHDIHAIADDESDAQTVWENQWKHQHLRYCVEQLRPHVSAETFEAFRLLTQEQKTVDQVCDQLQMTRNQVYKIKARMLQMIRQRMATLYSDVDATES